MCILSGIFFRFVCISSYYFSLAGDKRKLFHSLKFFLCVIEGVSGELMNLLVDFMEGNAI